MFATGGPSCQVQFVNENISDLKKCKTVARFISPLLKNRNPKSAVEEKEELGVNTDRLLHEKYGLGSRIGYKEKKVNQPFVTKTLVKKMKASNQ